MVSDSTESSINSNDRYSIFDSLNRAEYYLMSKMELNKENIKELLDNIKADMEKKTDSA